MSIKSKVKSLVPETMKWRYSATKIRRQVKANESLPMSEWRGALQKWYEEKTGCQLDLDNPRTLGEKTQWLKLWDSTPEKGLLADKYESKAIAARIIGDSHVVPSLGVWDSFAEIDFDKLPNAFVLKVTDASGANLFVRDKDGFDYKKSSARIGTWLASGQWAFRNGYELQYAYIKPRIVAEPMLGFDGGELLDYRFFCSWGNVFSVWVDTGSATHEYHRSVFSPDWVLQDVRATHPRHINPPSRPTCFSQMIDMACELSRDFALARVDFYEYQNRPLLGEITFTPQSGLGWFDPKQFDLWMGDQISLPKEKKPFRGVML